MWEWQGKDGSGGGRVRDGSGSGRVRDGCAGVTG